MGARARTPLQRDLGVDLPCRRSGRLHRVSPVRGECSAPFAAGNFVYIAASDLIPEVKQNHGVRDNAVHLAALVCGIALLYGLNVFVGR